MQFAKLKAILLLLVLLCLHAADSHAQSPQYENKVIERIDVIVNTETSSSYDPSIIKSRLKTREADLFSQTEFDNDLKNLAVDFDRVIPEIRLVNDKVVLALKVWLKPTIRTIVWKGNNKIKTKALQKELGITLCSVFDRQTFNKAFHKLKAYYVKEGFFEAQLVYNVIRDPCTNEVDIEVCINEGRAGRIKKILFSGLCKEEEDELEEMMITKDYSFLTSWVTNEGTYNEEAIQQDQFVILNHLQNKGFADAKVDIDVCEAPESNRIIIHVNVEKGPHYRIGKISFQGNTLFCNADVEKRMTICPGGSYSPEMIRDTVDAITSLYGRAGYIDANINYEPSLACEEFTYNIHFAIEEGEQYRVGLIKVFGNCSTQTNVILHETLLVPGEVFNTEKMSSTEERLQNIGFFKSVNVYAVRTEDECSLGANYRDVHIEVEETSTGHFGAFFGFSTVESLFAGFNVTESNFNAAGIKNLWCDGYKAVRGGGEYAHFTTTIGKKSRSYVLSWTKPYFMDTQWSVGFDFERSSTRYISKDYDIEASGYTLHADYQVNPFIRFGWHYRIRNTRTELSGDKPSKEEREARTGGLISASGVNINYDSTDHPLRPTKGFKSRLEAEYAGIGGDHTFFATAYLNTYYIPIAKDGVLKFRGDVKFIDPLGKTKASKIPLDERLFLGGDNIIRGYRAYKLGPQFKGGDPRGGISMQMLSVEYSHRLWKRLDGFVFCDSGHLSFKEWAFGRMSTALGFGVRFQLFESGPPLMMGMGFPLNPKKRSEVKKFFLTVGGRF